MIEIQLLLAAIIASVTVWGFEILLFNKVGDKQLSIALLKKIGIDNYTLCEKALCKMLQFTIGLSFVIGHELFSELNNTDHFFISTIFGIAGILMARFAFSLLLNGYKKPTIAFPVFKKHEVYREISTFSFRIW